MENKEFVDLIKKKLADQKKNPADPKKLEIKAQLIKELMDTMKGGMADEIKNVKGLKKVTVASDSSKGLEEGLDKAKDILATKKDPMEAMESEAEESCETPEEEQSEGKTEDTKIAEIEKELEDLKSKKKSLLSSVF
jgi:hypothetical protein